ncbi:class I SAM-dependent methyltransferase [Micromonospora sp. WMMD730]|uniref:class I SAM-dependent methyltransferase n=1 Tax=Micromonospora sp. WMMD730 TaxID=3404128 RepID=UPI003B951916
MNRDNAAATGTRSPFSFCAEAFRHPRAVGAVAPSSRALARELVHPIRVRSGGPLTVLEVGAGSGAVTRTILDVLPPTSRLDIVEVSPTFVARLRDTTRTATVAVEIHRTEIEEYRTSRAYDVIVSGLPMTNFDPVQVAGIMARFVGLLRPGGALAYFAYRGTRPARRAFAGSAEARRHAAVDSVMRSYQRAYATGQRTVWLNLPPARVWHLRRPGAA